MNFVMKFITFFITKKQTSISPHQDACWSRNCCQSRSDLCGRQGGYTQLPVATEIHSPNCGNQIHYSSLHDFGDGGFPKMELVRKFYLLRLRHNDPQPVPNFQDN
jgi:hypothetical protein